MLGGNIVVMVMFLVIGIVLVTYFYFRSKEKQLMIEKGLSHEQMMELMKAKRDPFIMLKLGIITLFVGLGLGAGFLLDAYSGDERWIPFFIVSMTGLGFIAAFLFTRKLKNGNGH